VEELEPVWVCCGWRSKECMNCTILSENLRLARLFLSPLSITFLYWGAENKRTLWVSLLLTCFVNLLYKPCVLSCLCVFIQSMFVKPYRVSQEKRT
jgi:hypothetical protein